MTLLDSLISYWKFDEASGNALDANSTNDLTENGTVGTDASGIINSARDSFSASNYFSHANSSDFQIGGGTSFSWSGWFKQDGSGGSNQVVFCKRTTNGVGASLVYMLRIDSGVPIFYWGVGSTFNSVSWGSTVSTGSWHFFTLGHDDGGSSAWISVDGGTRQTAGTSGSITWDDAAETNPFQVGASSDGSEPFSGSIDELAFWKKAITASDDTTLFGGGSGYPYSSFGGGGITISVSPATINWSAQTPGTKLSATVSPITVDWSPQVVSPAIGTVVLPATIDWAPQIVTPSLAITPTQATVDWLLRGVTVSVGADCWPASASATLKGVARASTIRIDVSAAGVVRVGFGGASTARKS